MLPLRFFYSLLLKLIKALLRMGFTLPDMCGLWSFRESGIDNPVRGTLDMGPGINRSLISSGLPKIHPDRPQVRSCSELFILPSSE